MGIIGINELAADRSANWSVSGGRNYTVTLDVTTDDQTIGPQAVLLWLELSPGTHYRFPLTTSASEQDLGAFLQSVKVDTIESGFEHRVTLEFGPYNSQIDGSATGPLVSQWILSPFEAPPTVRWSSSSEDFACTHDRDGKPILNKAGDPFDPPIQIPISTPIANVTRVLKAFDPAFITVFKDSVNETEWLGWAPESVLCQEITADKYYDADWGYLWNVSYQFSFRPSAVDMTSHGIVIDPGWAVQVLNAGLRQKKLKDAEHMIYEKRQIMIDGSPISSPENLDENGKYPADEPVYLSFSVRRTAEFALLGLPFDLFSASTS